MDKEEITLSVIQCDIAWEDKERNLQLLEERLRSLRDNMPDITVLPEMFSTGFCTSTPLAETTGGPTIEALKRLAAQYGTAITGSFLATEGGRYYNRAFFITPQGETHYYDKRHLFVMSEEKNVLTPGTSRTIFQYMGWNICLAVCYDLRFPSWLRNNDNRYDLLIIPANWPKARISAWNTLLAARAIENLCYVCGANRVGNDINNYWHNGSSSVTDFKGERITPAADNGEETILTAQLSRAKLASFRTKFPAWKDADSPEALF